jgi:predicted HD superfamily hydrolase involved in NAD metabolism
MHISNNTTFINELEHFIKNTLSPSRYQHSWGVAQLATQLAIRFNLDHNLALIAGWAHDCTREWPVTKQLIIIEQLNHVDAQLTQFPMLLHGYTAAYHLQQSLEFYNLAVDLAMQRHSIGNPSMNELDKVLFVADYLEAGRTYITPAHHEMLTNASLNKLFALSLTESVDYIKESGKTVHPTSLQLQIKYKEFL